MGKAPTKEPTSAPTNAPTKEPTSAPTNAPTTKAPTNAPSSTPTESMYPSSSPTNVENTATEAPTKCPPSLPILIENQGETMYPDLPVIITKQNRTHVGFKVENTFSSTVSSIFTEYHSGSFGENECLEEENVEPNVQIETEFLATCMHHTHISVINVWVTDCDEDDDNNNVPSFLIDEDDAEVPECCHPSEQKQCKTVQYTFKLPCISPCPDDDDGDDVVVSVLPIKPIVPEVPITIPEVPATKPIIPEVNNSGKGGLRRRRNLATTTTTNEVLEKEEGNTEEFENITGQHHDENEDDHFCVVEDYPCGPDSDKVHVCHYSARDGYKTFCVPEADSDTLRFYPKDYCGPCVGFGSA